MNIAQETNTLTMNNEFTMQSTMNEARDTASPSTLPGSYASPQAVFSKFATAHNRSIWNNGEERFTPQTPVTPSMIISPQVLEHPNSVKTELLTPDSFQDNLSPDELISIEDPPLFEGMDFGQANEWESLFLNDSLNCPEDNIAPTTVEVKQEAVALSTVPHNQSQDNLIAEVAPQQMPYNNEIERQCSPRLSTTGSPLGGVCKDIPKRDVKVDDLGITVYKRKPRATPLKPVEIPVDANGVLAKRAKNTEAARRSRARKLERMSQLETRVRSVLDENEQLRAEICRLKNSTL